MSTVTFTRYQALRNTDAEIAERSFIYSVVDTITRDVVYQTHSRTLAERKAETLNANTDYPVTDRERAEALSFVA